MGEFEQKPGAGGLAHGTARTVHGGPGKRTLTEQLPNVPPPSPGTQAGGSQVTPHAGNPAAGADHGNTKLHVAQPQAGIEKAGFIDNSKGAPLYSAPAEASGELVREAPLPPATRVFVSGTHPRHRHWWYVTAYLEETMVRGYVEDYRVNTALPEPFAELRQLDGGETPEGLAKEKFSGAVSDGHDLRYYENVLLYVNRGRDGVSGSYQDPGVLGGGSNNIKLFAGHRIWLVSAEYAKALESVVPSGSLTGGAVAKVKRFAGHLRDILSSVTESRHHLDEVAGEFAQAIRDHMPAIIGITAGFLMAEATSMFFAAAPTGVSQAAAVVIQLALSAFGVAGMVEGGIEALKHGRAWLTTAWTAHGKAETILEASKEFLQMLMAIAMAALSYLGAKGNYRNAIKIASTMPTGGLPAFAAAGSSASGGAQAGADVSVGPSTGALGAAGNATLRLDDKEKAALGEGPDVDGLREKHVGEASSQEGHDRRAADGHTSSTPSEDGSAASVKSLQRTRTELAKHIPPRGAAFSEWFDSLTLAELDELLANQSADGVIGAREVIAGNIRHPRGQHEWLLVAEARQFKKWGVSMKTIQEGRTLTEATIGKRFRHGSAGSGTMHSGLRAMIRSSSSYDEFLGELNHWADRELVPSHSARWPDAAPAGRYSLPDSLQLRSR